MIQLYTEKNQMFKHLDFFNLFLTRERERVISIRRTKSYFLIFFSILPDVDVWMKQALDTFGHLFEFSVVDGLTPEYHPVLAEIKVTC